MRRAYIAPTPHREVARSLHGRDIVAGTRQRRDERYGRDAGGDGSVSAASRCQERARRVANAYTLERHVDT